MSSPNQSNLKIEHSHVRGGSLIRLAGVIDDHFDVDVLVAGVEGVVVIDLDEVTRITSFGVRTWMTALQRLKCSWLGLIRCRPTMVAHLNMVSGFAGTGKVVSLYLPYICPKSGLAFEVLHDVRQHHAELSTLSPPAAACPDSGEPAEFDDVPESYLAYVAGQPVPELPLLAEQLINGGPVSDLSGSGLRLVKEVLGETTGLWLSGRLDEKDHFRRIADGLEGVLYISAADVTAMTEQGISTFLRFLKNVKVPIVLDSVPLSMVERVAVDPELSAVVAMRRVVLPARCPLHGAVSVVADISAMKASIEGEPLVLTCPQGDQRAEPTFPVSALRTVLTLREQERRENITALIDLHSQRVHQATATQPNFASMAPGSVVLGRYSLIRALGAGGMAEVFLARQTAVGGFDRSVVVKRILPGLATDAHFIEMFLQEARLAARLSHPNVVQIFDVGRDGEQYFIVMEYVHGWDLNAIIKGLAQEQKRCPPSHAARIIAEISRGLTAAHGYVTPSGEAQPIVHRDVSPHNVLVGKDGNVKITDFGVAKAADRSSLTPASVLKGKVAYMAPEQVRGATYATDPRADIFAVGLVLYQLLTGIHPYRRDTELATLRALLNDPVSDPSSLVPGIPKEIDAIARRALARDPSQRYATARDLERDLEAFIVSTGSAVSADDLAAWLATLSSLKSTVVPGAPGLATPSELPTKSSTPRHR